MPNQPLDTKTEIMNIIVEHFLVMRGKEPHLMADAIPFAEAILNAAQPSGVHAILDSMLEFHDLPVEDTDEVADQFYTYAEVLAKQDK